jgi:arsenical pump membrane protein
VAEALSLLCLAAVLLVAVARPRGVSEAAVAVPAAALLIAVHAVSWPHARAELGRLGPVVGFLAAVLALAESCAGDGLFRAAGSRLAEAANGSGQRLFAGVFVLAATTTAVLSLDTTVVLLTPVVLATAEHSGLRPRPHSYATGHLANTASLLLPVSNLTNLLAVAVVSISFARFTALMVMPWLVAVLVEYAVLRLLCRRDLRATSTPAAEPHQPIPRVAVAVVSATLAGFVACSFAGIAPVWAAVAGAAALAGKRLWQRRTTLPTVVMSTAPLFCLFVLALGVVVRAAGDHGLAHLVRQLTPAGSSLPALLGVAAVAAVVANVVNNLPAALLLTPVVAPAGVAPMLAVLIGVNVGPNLTYVGSLATLLWRRVLRAHGLDAPVVEFSVVGLATAPVVIVAATVALWLSIRVVGPG